MPRARDFDPDVVLVQAMKLFWRKGYGNTSVKDLVDVTGVNRHGLYDEFKSKHKLFLACLDHYQEAIVGSAFGTVERPGASLQAIRIYFQTALAHSDSQGCLMANTASDVAPYDRQAARKVSAFYGRLQTGFKTALLNAQANGELPSYFDVEKSADFLTGVTQGMSVMIRSSAHPAMIANIVETALACLK